MSHLTRRPKKRLTSLDSQIALVHVPQIPERTNCLRKNGRSGQDSIQIDNGFGNQTRHGGAPDMLHSCHNPSQRPHDSSGKCSKLAWPNRIVGSNVYWILIAQEQYSSAVSVEHTNDIIGACSAWRPLSASFSPVAVLAFS